MYALKAIVGALIAACGTLGGALTTSTHLTLADWLAAAVAGLLALSVVFTVPNKPPNYMQLLGPTQRLSDPVQPPVVQQPLPPARNLPNPL